MNVKSKPKPNAHDKYKGAKDSSLKITLVDKNGKETKIKR